MDPGGQLDRELSHAALRREHGSIQRLDRLRLFVSRRPQLSNLRLKGLNLRIAICVRCHEAGAPEAYPRDLYAIVYGLSRTTGASRHVIRTEPGLGFSACTGSRQVAPCLTRSGAAQGPGSPARRAE